MDILNKKSTVTTINYQRNLSLDDTIYKFDSTNFDFAFKLMDYADYSHVYDEEYFQVRIIKT